MIFVHFPPLHIMAKGMSCEFSDEESKVILKKPGGRFLWRRFLALHPVEMQKPQDTDDFRFSCRGFAMVLKKPQ